MKIHKDLVVWQNSIKLVKEIYSLTKDFPKEELFGLTSQMRRAAISIPSNIVEGSARNHSKEYIQFLYVSISSCTELETQLIISKELVFINDKNLEKFLDIVGSIRRMLLGLINSVKDNSKRPDKN